MTTFRKITVTCPSCSHQFETSVLTSTNTFGPRFTDLHVQAVGFQPLVIIINTCLECGFSGYLNDFEQTLDDKVKARIQQELSPIVRRESITPPRSYAFAAQIKQWQQAPAMQVGDLFLRAAWCCVDTGHTDNEASYRRSAISFFEHALENDQVSPGDEPTVTYLVGELYRRIGQLEQAQIWFDKVLARADEPDWQELEWLAQQQRDAPQERLP